MLALAICSTVWNLQLATVTYDQFSGLNVKISGVPIVNGSVFQYFEAKSGKGIYSSRYAPKQVTTLPDGSVQVRYNGDNGNAIGTHTITQTATGCKIRYEFRWRGTNPVRVQNCLAQIWAPSVSSGEIFSNGMALFAFDKPVRGDWESRKLASANQFEFRSPVADIHFKVTQGRASLYDARLYDQDWASDNCLFWLGQNDLVVKPGETTEVTAEWNWQLQPQKLPDPFVSDAKPQPVEIAANAHEKSGMIIPQPKKWESSIGFADLMSNKSTPTKITNQFAAIVECSWRIDSGRISVPIVWKKTLASQHPQSYSVDIRSQEVLIECQGEAELNYALQSLSQLVICKQERIWLPLGKLEDWPSVEFRGAHFISGQTSHPFLAQFSKRVLSRLKFNNAVIDVSRTRWKSIPDEESKDWQTVEEVSKLFTSISSQNIEPTPLIQSLGHMEWLLSGEYKTLAIDPEVPFILDVRKAKARELIGGIWNEALEKLKPSKVHFGLDEVSRRGMKDDPTLAARLWKLQLQYLINLSKTNKLHPMIWSDMMLASGEAPDATHAVSPKVAKEFRDLVPKNFMICDWHYAAMNNPSRYKSLATWKREGFFPIASSWWRPENIRSHVLEAINQQAGTLQTIWAGYSNDEATVLAQPEQFAALILAADYSWSGQTEPANKLKYNPQEALRSFLFAPKKRIKNTSGFHVSTSTGNSKSVTIGDIVLTVGTPVSLSTPLNNSGKNGYSSIEFAINQPVTQLAILCDSIGWQKEGEQIAQVAVYTASGVSTRCITYGGDVRAKEDNRITARSDSKEGKSSFIAFDAETPTDVKKIVITPISTTAGFRVYGLTGVR